MSLDSGQCDAADEVGSVSFSLSLCVSRQCDLHLQAGLVSQLTGEEVETERREERRGKRGMKKAKEGKTTYSSEQGSSLTINVTGLIIEKGMKRSAGCA